MNVHPVSPKRRRGPVTLDREHGAHKGGRHGHEYECMYTQIKMNGTGRGRGWTVDERDGWIERVHTRTREGGARVVAS